MIQFFQARKEAQSGMIDPVDMSAEDFARATGAEIRG